MSTLQDKITQLSPERQKRVLAHGQELIADEMTLRELRQALNITQEQLADRLESGQHSVSRLERRNDVKLSLNSYVSALGGELKVVASFPGHSDITLCAQLSTVDSAID